MAMFRIAAATFLAAASGVLPAAAETTAEFFKGKTITINIGVPAGGDYDVRGRLLARHMDRHIPGAPAIVARNMPGAGGVVSANWLSALAPRDGTALLMVMQNMPLAQALQMEGVKFKSEEYNWIGNMTDSPNLLSVMSTSRVKTVEDARRMEATIASAGPGSGSYSYTAAANLIGGTKFRIVTGYAGGSHMNLAMERGEVDGRGSNAWSAWKSTKPDWIAEKKLVHLIQIALKRHPDLPDVPLLLELASNDLDRKVVRLLSADTAISKALATSPGVPPDRVEALRRAYDATMKDPKFLEEADKRGVDVNPVSGEEVQKIVTEIVETEPEVRRRAGNIVHGRKD